jgi:hypothetical protein
MLRYLPLRLAGAVAYANGDSRCSWPLMHAQELFDQCQNKKVLKERLFPFLFAGALAARKSVTCVRVHWRHSRVESLAPALLQNIYCTNRNAINQFDTLVSWCELFKLYCPMAARRHPPRVCSHPPPRGP